MAVRADKEGAVAATGRVAAMLALVVVRALETVLVVRAAAMAAAGVAPAADRAATDTL
ncbi:hypothetical protein Tasa_048_070 [Tanticharoenia sakaeratensis NBRC 103193]|uniref:Uncharacterized protein n=1 Tax=Tanticharoenia sakaeratensis NBRC 103193 TaxID=1231623 RepID=A0A0D6MPX6_9PROT|nr:hypothetical protein Tasa_048_070 [Tanticharoenia sakaeratensis NBRC 103193]GBQ22050.1 hypothetical protein AA103193_1941 [Tanticharoenia sakaeratensis NBRC 103193]